MKIYFLSLIAMLFTLYATAGDTKIAVINMDLVFQKYYKTKLIDNSLKKQAELYKVWTRKLQESLDKMQKEFNVLRDASQNIALSSGERDRKTFAAQKKFLQMKEKKAELENYLKNKGKQFQALEQAKRAEIVTDIKDAVAKKCSVEGYTLVLDSSGKTLNGISAVIYVNSAFDLTDDIIKDLNRGQKPVKQPEETQAVPVTQQ
jgi:outer membrane protein